MQTPEEPPIYFDPGSSGGVKLNARVTPRVAKDDVSTSAFLSTATQRA
jgi:hypothetical protein